MKFTGAIQSNWAVKYAAKTPRQNMYFFVKKSGKDTTGELSK